MQNPSSALARNKAIDALRGLAALVVVFGHSRAITWVGYKQLWHDHHLSSLNVNVVIAYLLSPFIYGLSPFSTLAVAVFFVVSGYCIHRPNVNKLAKDPNHQLALGEYFKRRLWRIYPVLIGALILTAVLDHYLGNQRFESWDIHFVPTTISPSDLQFWHYLPGSANPVPPGITNFFINVISLQNILGPAFGTNGPLWTLGVELHFYFIYPLLFMATRKKGPMGVCLMTLVISTIGSVLIYLTKTDRDVFLMFWSTWMIGFFLAEVEAGRATIPKLPWTAIVWPLLAIGCVLNNLDFAKYRGFCMLMMGFWAGWAVWVSLTEAGSRFWSHKVLSPLVFAGLFSYSLYATHMPVLHLFAARTLDGKRVENLIYMFIGVAVCIPVGLAMFWLVERHTLRLPNSSKPVAKKE